MDFTASDYINPRLSGPPSLHTPSILKYAARTNKHALYPIGSTPASSPPTLRNPRKIRTPFLSLLTPHKTPDIPPGSEPARATPAGSQIRPDPILLKWDLADLPASDGHIARAIFTT